MEENLKYGGYFMTAMVEDHNTYLDRLEAAARNAEEAEELATTSGTTDNEQAADDATSDMHGMLRPEYVRWLITRARRADEYAQALRDISDYDVHTTCDMAVHALYLEDL